MTNLLADITVLILAGGLGTRLRSVLPDRPKGLAPIGARSFLDIQIHLLRKQGAQHFVLCVGHQAEQIRAEFGDGSARGVQIEYSVEAPDHLLGTAGALKLAERYFAPRALVLNGDTYFDIKYAELVEHHLAARAHSGVLATLALAQAVQRERYGSVMLDSAGQYIVAFKEKEAGSVLTAGWVSGGAYIVERELLDYVLPGQAASIEKDVFPQVIAEGRCLAAMKADCPFFDIGTPEAWQAFARYYLKTQNDRPPATDSKENK